MKPEIGQEKNNLSIDCEVVSDNKFDSQVVTRVASKVTSPARILIVDDVSETVRVLKLLLQAHGYPNLCSTTDSSQVTALFREFQPDLLLLDLMMPHLDGFQVLEQLRDLIPAGTFVPIVVMTALSDAPSKERALKAGAHDFITKPYIPSEVLLRIRNLLQLRDLNLRLLEQNQDMAIFRAIVDSSHDAIVSKTLKGIITSWNRGAETLFGYAADEAIGQSILMLFPPDRQEEEVAILAQQMRGERIDHLETVRLRKDGQSIDVSLTVSPIRAADGTIIGVSKIARDITERKRAEAEREELLASEKSARHEAERARHEAEAASLAKSEFLSRMSHELRTPLNAILGFGQLLEMRLQAANDRQAVEQILKGGQRLLGLVNELLDINRIESGRLAVSLEPVRLSAVLQEALELAKPLALLRHIQLPALNQGAGVRDCCVMADEHRLQQVLINLLSNAIKYNRSGGSVDLRCQILANDQVRIEVCDDGPGIAPSDLGKAFLPFERLNAEASGIDGTGLGLALCRGMIEGMSGRIGLESVVGEGTTAWVELPMATASIPHPMDAGHIAS